MNLKTSSTPIVVWSLLWALSFIATAFFFKGNPAASWMEATLNTVGMLVFLALNSRRKACA